MFGHSNKPTNLSPSSGESLLSSADVIKALETNVIICKKNLCRLNRQKEVTSSCPHKTDTCNYSRTL